MSHKANASLTYTIISENPQVQALYQQMRSSGESHHIAEMLALRQVPALMTDAVFLEGHANGNQFERSPLIGDHYKKIAAEQGVDVKGKVYLSSLAEMPGDPRAWVSGRGDVEAICRERGYSCEGSVKVRSVGALTPPPEIDVADDIVQAEVAKVLDREPHKQTHLGEVVHDVKQRLKPHWKK